MVSNQIIHDILKKEGDFVHLSVEGDGYHYHITAASELFQNMSRLVRQQWFYTKLNDFIVSGSLHAITIKAYTPEEWAKINNGKN